MIFYLRKHEKTILRSNILPDIYIKKRWKITWTFKKSFVISLYYEKLFQIKIESGFFSFIFFLNESWVCEVFNVIHSLQIDSNDFYFTAKCAILFLCLSFQICETFETYKFRFCIKYNGYSRTYRYEHKKRRRDKKSNRTLQNWKNHTAQTQNFLLSSGAVFLKLIITNQKYVT